MLPVFWPLGSACRRKCSFTASLVVLLYAEASQSEGWELNAVVPLLAVPVAGNCSGPPIPTLIPLSEISD